MGVKKIVAVEMNGLVYLGDGKKLYGDVSRLVLGQAKWNKIVALCEAQEKERQALWDELKLDQYCKAK